MTPKEKALELVDKLYQTTPNESWYNPPLGSLSIEYKSWEQSKQCALIAVEEIQEAIRYLDNDSENYWFEVKKEIEKL